ncbi:PHP domain-containing protein [Clostridium sp. 'deep sea']|uniref:PHP domain-containing protein n=1 Tax=Clostridium sp. 'deep sea' TaxID=2779445 RepID=UPI0018966DC7|nr:PHP domain-containing protein [Clostridium sp. 'deep sea']QOR36853.1 PHP domain-containing protein [Clostridium sp. 'deep sea']
MLIDLHLHTSEFSTCSRVSFNQIVEEALRKGLKGICITDHDTMAAKKFLNDKLPNDLLVIVGTEVLTLDGDILVFGVPEIPKKRLTAQELVDYVSCKGGACIAAHPYRKNLRGIGDKIKSLDKLTAIEGYNGNTISENNIKAAQSAKKKNKPVTGASDAHSIDRVGCFATYFYNRINNEQELIAELKKGQFMPMYYDENTNKYKEIKGQ